MSGLVAGYGTPSLDGIREMLARIDYRGDYLSGTWQHEAVALGQNYLRADCPGATPGVMQVPLSGGRGQQLRICYDGQMGNHREMVRELGVAEGPFLEERLLLHLFEEKGPDMLSHLGDAIFAFVISDGDDLIAARDLLGIKTLFYGYDRDTLYFASEMKSLLVVTEDVREFPAGHYMNAAGELTRFAQLPESASEASDKSLDEIVSELRDIIGRSVRNRVDFAVPTGSLLSGGLDSSVISYIAAEIYREKYGKDARLPTFVIGLGESEDIFNARLVAEHIGSDHHELIVNLDELFAVLAEVIYYLESFDPSLVRSSVANFLGSRYARGHGIETLLSGEGGDEMYCGYTYLKGVPYDELFQHQMTCFGYLHSNAALRLDRMNQCNSLRVVAPLISGELFEHMLSIPSEYKLRQEGDRFNEKWILKKAYENDLPSEVLQRNKQEFSQGSGVADLLPARIEQLVSDRELREVQEQFPFIRNKEEMYYFRLFSEHFGFGIAMEAVGQWITT
jgi:asparagine synthase (glutamine-hydrolysing)